MFEIKELKLIIRTLVTYGDSTVLLLKVLRKQKKANAKIFTCLNNELDEITLLLEKTNNMLNHKLDNDILNHTDQSYLFN